MTTIRELLSDPTRLWVPRAAATNRQIDALRKTVGFALPSRYVEFLLESNGGEGELALAPLWLQLFDAEMVARIAGDKFTREFPGLFFIGSNGGLEYIAFDMRGPFPWPIVMVDPIAGLESAEKVADSFDAFIEAIGLSSSPADAQPRSEP
jgi:hypothetical protein